MNPLTGLYGAASGLRNVLFDRGIFSARQLDRPVVSVGNLSMGGSGKTPFVIALGELLKARGISFDVLSRGYRRKTTGVLVVEANGSAAEFGDEPLLVARRLGVPVIVGESRYHAGLLAEKKFGSQLHILDDGFQHRSLSRDFDIVLMGESDFHDQLLPAGRLREPLFSLKRADAIILPTGAPVDHVALRGKLVWRITRNLAHHQAPKLPVVFCGLARPEQFFAQVRAAGISPAAEIEFRDHHAYQADDIQALIRARQKHSSDGYLTTEKDAINLGANRSMLESLSIATLNVELDNPADIVDTILKRIEIRRLRS
jgi:tetraacyldisaccharide 4'-kinase